MPWTREGTRSLTDLTEKVFFESDDERVAEMKLSFLITFEIPSKPRWESSFISFIRFYSRNSRGVSTWKCFWRISYYKLTERSWANFPTGFNCIINNVVGKTFFDTLKNFACLLLSLSCCLYRRRRRHKTVPRARIVGPSDVQVVKGSTISLTCMVNLQASLILWWGHK